MLQLMAEMMGAHGAGMRVFRPPYGDMERIDKGLRRQIFQQYDYGDIAAQLARACHDHTVYYVTDPFELRYMIFKVPARLCPDGEKQYAVIGPFIFRDHTEIAQEVVDRHRLPLFQLAELKEFYLGIPLLPMRDVSESEVLVLARHLFGGESFTFDRTSLRLDGSRGPLEPKAEPESTISMAALEARYRAEDDMLDAVSRGDLKKAMAYQDAFRSFRLEPRNSDSLRNKKNLIISLNTLFRKTVQRAEVHPAHIDRLSASLAKQIERAQNLSELSRLTEDMMHKYCLLVQNHSLRGYSQTVQRVINFVEFNLYEPLSLKSLSELVNVSASYLSTQFKKETGATLTDFINEKRIRQSILLLNTTDLSIQAIAERVGFSDENYFSRLFKRQIGKPPREYRKTVQPK